MTNSGEKRTKRKYLVVTALKRIFSSSNNLNLKLAITGGLA
jgi:hypothetical protein